MLVDFCDMLLCIYYKTLTIYKFTEVKLTMHIGIVKLCRTVTTDGNIFNQAIEVKITVHIGFVK